MRRNLDWNRTTSLQALKMLAWVVYANEGTEASYVWMRAEQLCEPVLSRVLGENGLTLARICQETLADQGLAITKDKLLQRADKTERYEEFNHFVDAVLEAYRAVEAEG